MGSASASSEREEPKPRAQQLRSPLDLASLLARVEAAKGPDREIAADLARLLTTPPEDGCEFRSESAWPFVGHWRNTATGVIAANVVADDYTASIDAALALVERVRPDWRLQNLRETRIAGHEWNAHLQCWRDGVRCWGRTAPLAILAALLKALIASADGTEL